MLRTCRWCKKGILGSGKIYCTRHCARKASALIAIKARKARVEDGSLFLSQIILNQKHFSWKLGFCWDWVGTLNSSGYGCFGGRGKSAHRWSYEKFKGPIPYGMEVDHLCANPCCVNPEHLEAVTGIENIRRQHLNNKVPSKPEILPKKLVCDLYNWTEPLSAEEFCAMVARVEVAKSEGALLEEEKAELFNMVFFDTVRTLDFNGLVELSHSLKY